MDNVILSGLLRQKATERLTQADKAKKEGKHTEAIIDTAVGATLGEIAYILLAPEVTK